MTVHTEPRPKRSDFAILEAAARELAPKVKKWCGPERPDDERLERDLIRALNSHSQDGYDLARSLDRAGWSPDSELVDILDDAGRCVRHEHERAEMAWVKDNYIIPPAKIGEYVASKSQPALGTGIVYDNAPSGHSSVSFISSGHVGHLPRSQHKPHEQQTLGLILAWEDLELLPLPSHDNNHNTDTDKIDTKIRPERSAE